ncbi:unnamed protein product [Arabidopsis arenosa]|uniref:Uncharacterized protein n=1 Tax=Arabidopsis arenosa TaxID=38785 RepID=A0A8S1ZY39_ARAAE|nr:unnamed protein product [Arabidopsis arenosa]
MVLHPQSVALSGKDTRTESTGVVSGEKLLRDKAGLINRRCGYALDSTLAGWRWSGVSFSVRLASSWLVGGPVPASFRSSKDGGSDQVLWLWRLGFRLSPV